MSDGNGIKSSKLPMWIVYWFILDAILALAPPLHWAVDGQTTLLMGVPVVIIYFVAVGICITASLIAAYLSEAAAGAFE